jgi:hypothetical protein
VGILGVESYAIWISKGMVDAITCRAAGYRFEEYLGHMKAERSSTARHVSAWSASGV